MGRPKLCNPCCAGSAGSSASSSRRTISSIADPGGCPQCDAFPAVWQVSGLIGTNAKCNACTDISTTLPFQSGTTTKQWGKSLGSPCSYLNIVLTINSSCVVTLFVNNDSASAPFCSAGQDVTYSATITSPTQCFGPLTLNKISEQGLAGRCCTFPATVTIAAA